MRKLYLCLWIGLWLACCARAQPPQDLKPIPPAPIQPGPVDERLKALLEGKVKAEWEALKNKDKKAYGDLLADDYQGVEIDGQGERNRLQMLGELGNSNVSDYSLWGFKLIPLGADAAFVIYESTMQYPPRSVVRLSRIYISELWVKRNGEWKELHYQETHVK